MDKALVFACIHSASTDTNASEALITQMGIKMWATTDETEEISAGVFKEFVSIGDHEIPPEGNSIRYLIN